MIAAAEHTAAGGDRVLPPPHRGPVTPRSAEPGTCAKAAGKLAVTSGARRGLTAIPSGAICGATGNRTLDLRITRNPLIAYTVLTKYIGPRQTVHGAQQGPLVDSISGHEPGHAKINYQHAGQVEPAPGLLSG